MEPLKNILLLAIAFASVCSGLAPAEPFKIRPRQLQSNGSPSVNTFISRAYHASIVVGNDVYIDGGEINYYDSGDQIQHLPDNNTYSIDLSTSWTNQTVVFNKIEKTAPVMNSVLLWADPSNNNFYAYGGEQSGALPNSLLPPIPYNALWEFTINGSSGSWSKVNPITVNSIFPGLQRASGAIGAYGGGLGISLGGFSTKNTQPQTSGLTSALPLPGLVSYNMSANTWTNNSATGLAQYGTAMHGQMQYAPNMGERGLFVLVGGETSALTAFKDRGIDLFSFQTIHLYDGEFWYNQTATGDIPQVRDRFCSVGVQGNGTFEIFIYGGHVAATDGPPQTSPSQTDKDVNLPMDSVYVLTIPGFNWQKANYTPTHPRIDHTCNLVGNRQMLVVGGVNTLADNTSQLWGTPDIFAQGLGVFDLTTMTWNDSYNAQAAAYTSPEVVQAWYRQNGPYPSSWDDPALEALITHTAVTSKNSTTGNSTTDGGSTGSKSNAGVIAGSVVGSLVGLALVGGVAWLILRRRRNNSKTEALSDGPAELLSDKLQMPPDYIHETPAAPVPPQHPHAELPSPETPTQYWRHELSPDGIGGSASELSTSRERYELP